MAYRKRSRSKSRMGARRRRRCSRINRRRFSRRKSRGALTRVARGPPVADRQIVHLKYKQWNTITQLTATEVTLWRAQTSLFEPFVGSVSQPLWYDQLCSATGLWLQYRVMGFSWKCRFNATHNVGTTSPGTYIGPWMVTVVNNPTLITLTGRERAEQRGSKVGIGSGALNDGKNTVTLRGYCDLAKTLGITKGQAIDEDYCAAWNANPAVVAYTTAVFTQQQPNFLPGLQINVHYDLEMTFHAVLFNKRRPLQS